MCIFRQITVLVLTACWLGCGPADADTRVALVIGNGAYQTVRPRLTNPPNDAKDVAAALQRSGFETVLATDLDKNGMDEAAIRFARAARNADVALFYYAGHAFQYNGVNYLVPVDARLEDEADLRRMSRVDEIVTDLQQAKNLRILVLDSCRDNPLAEQLRRSMGASRSIPLQRGLAKIDALGMIVAYSTQAGQTAEDGDGRNSPYTSALLKHIEEQEEIGDIFREVSEDVYETTKHAQLPELSLSIIGRFYLRGKVEAALQIDAQLTPTPSATANPCSAAADHWHSAEAIGTIEALQDHLRRFPDCSFAGLAKAKIDTLKRTEVAALAPQTTGPSPATAELRGCEDVDKSSGLAALREKNSEWSVVPSNGKTGRVNALAISPDGSRIASGSLDDNTIKIWDRWSGNLLQTLPASVGGAKALAFSQDGTRIVLGDDKGTIKVWDTLKGLVLTLEEAHYHYNGGVSAVAISPDNNNLISAGVNNVKIWDAASGRLRRTESAQSVFLAGKLVVSLDGRSIKIWNTTNGSLQMLRNNSDDLIAMAMSSNGNRIIAVGSNAAGLWDIANGSLVRTFTGAGWEMVASVAITADGSRVISGEFDNTVKIWDAASGNLLQTLRGHTDRITAVAITPDGRQVVTASWDGSIRLWDIASTSPPFTLFSLGPNNAVTVRSDGTFWTDPTGLTQIRLVRGNEAIAVTEEYKAAFLREKPLGCSDDASAHQ